MELFLVVTTSVFYKPATLRRLVYFYPFFILVFSQTQLVCQIRVTDREIVRPQPANSVLGQLGEQEAGQSAQSKEPQVAVQLNYDPGSPVAIDGLLSVKIKIIQKKYYFNSRININN